MNWMLIAVSAVAGGLAALVAAKLIPDREADTAAHGFVVVLTFAVLMACAAWFLPLERGRGVISQDVEDNMLALPVYAGLKKHYPAEYQTILNDIESFAQEGASAQMLEMRIRGRIADVVVTKIPNASDEAVIAFLNTLLRQLNELNDIEEGLCMSYLSPHVFGSRNLLELLSQESIEKEQAAVSLVLATSAGGPRGSVDEVAAGGDLERILDVLENTHGIDLDLLNQLENPEVDKARACEATTVFYQEILNLPPVSAATVARYLFAL